MKENNSPSGQLSLTETQSFLIEKFGILQEKAGFQPTAARILGLLLIADKTELTFDEIRSGLNISKSAASNALNLLMRLNKIEYITLPGDRKRYFKSRIEDWKTEMKTHMEGFVTMNCLFKEILSQRHKGDIEFNQSLSELISFLDYVEKEIPLLFQRWADINK